MLKQALLLLVLIFYLTLPVLGDSIVNSKIYVQCSEHHFTSMTPYESNVNSLFASIIDSSSIYNFNKFEISPPEYSQKDVVFGLFQCRGDLISPNCKDCVTNSISQLKTNCPSSTGGRIQLDGCFVKYDNSSFFGVEDKMEVVKTCGPSIGYNSDVLNRIDGALRYVIAGNGQYFRASNDESIESVAQCVQDLSVSNCQDCLTEARERLRSECETSAWGNMYLGKCYITYFNQGDDSHGHNGSSSSNKSSGGGKLRAILKYVAIIILGGGVAAGGTYVLKVSIENCCNNTNSNNNTINVGELEQKVKKLPEENEKVMDKKIEERVKIEYKKLERIKEERRRAKELMKPRPNHPPSNYPFYPQSNDPFYPPPMPRENQEETCTIM